MVDTIPLEASGIHWINTIITVLGSGRASCVNLVRATRQALVDLGPEAAFEKVTDYPSVVGYGVMSTPAPVVDQRVVTSGRVPSGAELRVLLAGAVVA